MVAPVPFPPKQVFGRFESSIIKDRVEGITVWLNAVLAMPVREPPRPATNALPALADAQVTCCRA